MGILGSKHRGEKPTPKAALKSGEYDPFYIPGRPHEAAVAAMGKIGLTSDGDPIAELDESYTGKSFSVTAGYNFEKFGIKLKLEGHIAGEFTEVNGLAIKARIDADASTFPVVPEDATMEAVYDPNTGYSLVTVNAPRIRWSGIAEKAPSMVKNGLEKIFDSKIRNCLGNLALETTKASPESETLHTVRSSSAA